jgi:putative membrane protein
MLDLVLAIAHHLIVFSLFGIVFAEFIAVKKGITSVALAKIASIDLWYGLLAALILIVGFSRAVFAAKGWDYYSHNVFFWLKIGTFAVIGLLSVPPTISFLRWRRTGLAPSDHEVSRVRLFLHSELALFVPLLAFAAAMARGFGEWAH